MTTAAASILTPAQLEQYETQGYVVVENVVSPDTLAELRQRVADICERMAGAQASAKARARGEASTTKFEIVPEPGADGPVLRKLAQLAPADAFFRSVACGARIVDVVAQLTQATKQIMLYSDQVFLKPARHGSEKPLHQDNSYFKITPARAGVTCWMALDDATVENGCLHYIPGSHKLGLIEHKSIEGTPHLVPASNEGLAELTPCPVPAGGAVFHQTLTLHASKANRSDHARRAWALHYASRDAESCVRPWAEMMPVR